MSGTNIPSSPEDAIRILTALLEEIIEDIPADSMSRHLKDAVLDAKQFLGFPWDTVNDEGDDDDDDEEGE